MGTQSRNSGNSQHTVSQSQSQSQSPSGRGPRPPRRRPAAALGAAAALLTLAAAGCGSDGTTSAATTLPSAPTVGSDTPASPSSDAPTTPSGGPAPSATSDAPTTSPSAAAGAAPSRCLATQLGIALGKGDPGAGNVYYPLELTNKAARSCTLDGFPGVSLLRGDGSTIGKPATREGGPATAVRLAPGATVRADLHTLNRGVKGDSCWKAPTLIKVYPPGDTDSLTLSTGQPVVCGDTFTVSPVK